MRLLSRSSLLVLGPALGIALDLYLQSMGWSFAASATAAITLVCALWWIFEPVPIPFTSLLPLALFPMLQILTPAQVGQAYGSPLILLLLGGFLISEAMADSGAHKRLALYMVNIFGGNSARALVLGFMTAAAVLSMWISNTATTLMLLPVALAVLAHADRRLAVPLLLGIAYAASIGGIGTPIGTPPNLVFMQVYENQFGDPPTFPEWMLFGLPVVLLMVPMAGLWLTRGLRLQHPVQLPSVGAWQPVERRVLAVFLITAAAWVTRSAPFGGWSSWLALPGASDATVALLAAVVMAMLPAGSGDGRRLLRWEAAKRIPWEVLILFGAGITIASAFIESGLADQIAAQLTVLTTMPTWLMILLICLSVTFMTEVTSNTATSSLLMPLLASAAVVMEVNPMLLMVPAAMSASCAFMLPVATAPNAVIYGSGRVRVEDMARAGLVLNLLGAVVITAVCYFFLG
jgi:sodium-dependent dicarboxylate transporter 2/3/5